ncbi:MAG: acetoin utilization protein AcuC [Phycisphaerae bacterium]|nr:acetoin utilization protein AcuC [Phycisphaerae bacterium]NIR66786.1 acetoin utilization protein AcuC [candidate division Zixibacteria bacterium]NIP52655.1 acetoin utilization protein AcuC [Phycisphaerae bacterium]NIS49860.1 acetoin utilization protein AcuC [Phycisphaerae bacterium]NIU07953.1 acetoin utilization protein AcuC [Phycisphaerae bacterium]
MRKAAFIYSRELEKYGYPPEHPFNTIRPKSVRAIAHYMGLLSGGGRSEVAPVPAERMVLKKFHTARYLHALRKAHPRHWDAEAFDMGIGTSDCPVFSKLYDYVVLASGATLVGAKLILSGSADVAFNPSGGFHHAGPERASGFCYINDVALACTVLAEAGKRVLYLDVDVHHGDGVAYAFYERSDVMTISLHENPKVLFPGTGFENEIGKGKGKGYCVNVPLPIGTYDQAYMNAFNAIARPIIEAFKSDVIVIQLGADALSGDPLAHLYLTNNVYADILSYLLSLGTPILATGGGGYNVSNTIRAWALAWCVLCGADSEDAAQSGAGAVGFGIKKKPGGLRDSPLPVSAQQRDTVTRKIETTIEAVKANVFGIHGL